MRWRVGAASAGSADRECTSRVPLQTCPIVKFAVHVPSLGAHQSCGSMFTGGGWRVELIMRGECVNVSDI